MHATTGRGADLRPGRTRELGDSRVQEKERACTLHRGGISEVVVSNRFQLLQESDLPLSLRVGGLMGLRHPDGHILQEKELVIVGDSILRGVDSIVCARDKDSRTVCCLPGAQVGDILDRVDKLLARAGRDPVVMVHVGTNDIGKGRFDVLQEKNCIFFYCIYYFIVISRNSTCTTCKQREAELYLEV